MLGRDLLTLPEGDKGSGVIKPSGSDQTVAIISDDHLLVQPKDMPAKVWQYKLGANPEATVVTDTPEATELKKSSNHSCRPRPKACWTTPQV
jgi:hypothetical protein